MPGMTPPSRDLLTRIRAAEVVCFDNDGTLFDSMSAVNPAIQRVYVAFVRSAGMELPAPTDAEVCAHTGKPGLQFFHDILPPELRSRAAEFREMCVDEEAREVLSRGELYDGLREFLIELRGAGRKLALATNGGERYIAAVAQRLGYDRLLDGVWWFGRDGIDSKIGMLRAARAALGGGGMVMVGDRTADVEAARATESIAVGCLWGFGGPLELADADVLVETSRELRTLWFDP